MKINYETHIHILKDNKNLRLYTNIAKSIN